MSPPGCFVAGTLVHTRQGLRPIESIRVGDEVLSKPEDGVGGPAYKRVTRTFEYEDRELYLVTYCLRTATPTGDWRTEHLAVTGAHPFWVKNRIDALETFTRPVNAWMTAGELFDEAYVSLTVGDKYPLRAEVELPDGSSALIQGAYPILKTADSNVGLMTYCTQEWQESLDGTVVRFTPSGPQVNIAQHGGFEGALMDLAPQDLEGVDEQTMLYRTSGFEQIRHKVYDIEVEDSHTCYVGAMGVLVRNTSGVESPPPRE